MFKLYRIPEQGEFVLIGGDCSQGGSDSNSMHCLSRNKLDYFLTYNKRGVAAQMTSDVFPVLEWIFDVTGVQPVVALERQNGGASEMERLNTLNRLNKYRIYMMRKIGVDDDETETNKFGWDTNVSTRPTLLGDYRNAIDTKAVKHYDPLTVSEHLTFIVNKNGKPEASKGKHDDTVISSAICWQLYQTETPVLDINITANEITHRNTQKLNNWRIG